MKRIALIPARKGSNRIKDKNIRLLNGLPLIAYSIIAAKKSKLFDKIFVITDSKRYLDIGKKYGADLFKLRPSKISTSRSVQNLPSRKFGTCKSGWPSTPSTRNQCSRNSRGTRTSTAAR